MAPIIFSKVIKSTNMIKLHKLVVFSSSSKFNHKQYEQTNLNGNRCCCAFDFRDVLVPSSHFRPSSHALTHSGAVVWGDVIIELGTTENKNIQTNKQYTNSTCTYLNGARRTSCFSSLGYSFAANIYGGI